MFFLINSIEGKKDIKVKYNIYDDKYNKMFDELNEAFSKKTLIAFLDSFFKNDRTEIYQLDKIYGFYITFNYKTKISRINYKEIIREYYKYVNIY